MKTNLILAFFALAFQLGTVGCQAQDKDERKSIDTFGSAKPKVSWKVNKTYDKAGKLIRYDSVYSWSYADTIGNIADSTNFSRMLEELKSPLQRQAPFSHAWQDTLMPERFREIWRRHLKARDAMLKDIDSLSKSWRLINPDPETTNQID